MKEAPPAGEQDPQGRLRDRVTQMLGVERAQLLGYVPVELAALGQLEHLSEVWAGLDELRDVVRVELGRVLQLAEEIRSTAAPNGTGDADVVSRRQL